MRKYNKQNGRKYLQANLQMFAVQQRTSIWDIWDFGELQKSTVKNNQQQTKPKTIQLEKGPKV